MEKQIEMSAINYQHIIVNILENKRFKNPSYSIRALARDIKISPSGLVDIINGKKKVTPFIAYKLAAHLKLSESDTLKLIVHSFN